jgi:hypothetical protein
MTEAKHFSFPPFPNTAPQTGYAIQHPDNSAPTTLTIADAGISKAIQHSVLRLLFSVAAQSYDTAYAWCSQRLHCAGLWRRITG